MKRKHMKRRVQRGFTLVELAIVLVIAGLILVAVLRGTDAIQNAQVARMVSDLRGLQGILLSFQKRTGRLPGDCDNNGVLRPSTNVRTRHALLEIWPGFGAPDSILDSNPANRIMPATPVGTGPNLICIDSNPAREVDINLVWNELRRAGLVDANRLPRELARHSMGDVFLVSTMFDTPALGGQPAGVIMVYGIPVWMAEAVDAAIDGTATLYGRNTDGHFSGPASTGRVRLVGGPAGGPVHEATKVFTASGFHFNYDQNLSDRDRRISISFQYTPNKLVD